MSDKETLQVYAKKAEEYAKILGDSGSGRYLRAFMAELPEGAHVLDYGCGIGNAAAAMRDAGLRVDAWDASPEMAELGRARYGIEIEIRTFETLDAAETYDGIYANFSLLHAPKSDMPGHLARIHAALKPGGLLHFGTKLGTGEKRDALGRFYAYYSDEEITGLLEAAGFSVTKRDFGEEVGLSGSLDPWIILQARKNAQDHD